MIELSNVALAVGLEFGRDDVGNAHRMAHYASDELRYVKRTNQWYNWDGRRWNPATEADMIEVARRVVGVLYREVGIASVEGDPSPAATHAIFASKSHSDRAIKAMINLVRGDARLWQDQALFDSDPFLLNFLNGTLDLRLGTLRAHDRADYVTTIVRHNYNPAAGADRWRALVGRAFQDYDLDGQTSRFVQKALGYSLLGVNLEQFIFFLVGDTNTGKTKMLEIVSELVGSGYAHKSKPSLISRVRGGHHDSEQASIVGARLVTISETSSTFNLDENTVKELVGDRRAPTRELYRSKEENSQITWTIWLATNEYPNVIDWDDAVARRVVLIPSGPTIPEHEVIKHLDMHIIGTEAEGVLAWLVEGARMWYVDWQLAISQVHAKKTGLAFPDSVVLKTAEYAMSQDHLQQFIDECVVQTSDGRTPKSDVHAAFKRWRGTGEVSNRNKLYAAIKKIPGVTEYRGREFHGIFLRQPTLNDLFGRASEARE